jgi:hypothetical protein
MKIISSSIIVFFGLYFFCKCSNSNTFRAKSPKAVVLKQTDKLYLDLKNYFDLSEKRALENWYNIYLNECKLFYKIENPTKDSILNLIKSYWLTSDNQTHIIKQITAHKIHSNMKEVFVKMDYSYRIIATNTFRKIDNLVLQIIWNKRNKVLSIKEWSRG